MIPAYSSSLIFTAQPSIISLFSSTSSHPLLLATSIRSGHTAESFVSLLKDCSSQEETLLSFNGQPTELEQRTRALLQGEERQNTRSRVLHLQGPDIRKTSVRWGNWLDGRGKVEGLGIQLEYLHLQVKNLEQDFYFDVAVQDDRKEVFVFRCSTFQVRSLFLPLVRIANSSLSSRNRRSQSAIRRPTIVPLCFIFPSLSLLPPRLSSLPGQQSLSLSRHFSLSYPPSVPQVLVDSLAC